MRLCVKLYALFKIQNVLFSLCAFDQDSFLGIFQKTRIVLESMLHIFRIIKQSRSREIYAYFI